MSTYGLSLNQIDATCVESLLANGVAENRQLEYKEQLPREGVEEDKREFLRDVTSFANTAGGDFIYGLGERRDADTRPTGIPETIVGLPSVNLDHAVLRLEALIRNGVEPRIPGVTFHQISRGAEPPCLLLRIPRSLLGLHMVTYGGMSRFYGRGTSGRFQLDVAQIRAGFLEAGAAYERVRRFRLERVASILGDETPILLGPGPKAIFHALPLNPAEIWSRVVSIGAAEIGSRRLPPLAGTPGNWRYNLDGFVVHTVRSDLSRQTYVQLFRDGGIEAVSGGILAQDPRREGFYGLGLEQALIGGLSVYQRFWGELGVAGPMAMGLALSGIKGWKVLAGPGFFGDREETFDREVAILPEVLVHDVGAPADQGLKPLLDLVWNAGGWPESPHYRDGRWARPA